MSRLRKGQGEYAPGAVDTVYGEGAYGIVDLELAVTKYRQRIPGGRRWRR